MYYRLAALVVSFVFLGLSAQAQTLDLRLPRELADTTCTDTNDTPATTVNVNLITSSNWDSVAEAINPDLNLNDAAQVSGSADGWCDAKPWVMSGIVTLSSSDDLYLGPLTVPRGPLYVAYDFDVIGTNYSIDFRFIHPYGVGFPDTMNSIADATSLAANYVVWGPFLSENLTATDVAFSWPLGVEVYMVLDLNDAATWDYSLGTVPGRSPFILR